MNDGGRCVIVGKVWINDNGRVWMSDSGRVLPQFPSISQQPVSLPLLPPQREQLIGQHQQWSASYLQ